jgi:hypothetical protein
VPELVTCAGITLRRLCDLIDPDCPQFSPSYRELIVRESQRPPEFAAARLEPSEPASTGNDSNPGAQAIASFFDCCGGGIPPGILDYPAT